MENSHTKYGSENHIAQWGPRYRNCAICSPVEDIAEGGQTDHHIDRAILSRHHAIVADHRMLSATHRADFAGRHQHRMRSKPHHQTGKEGIDEVLEIHLIPLSPL